MRPPGLGIQINGVEKEKPTSSSDEWSLTKRLPTVGDYAVTGGPSKSLSSGVDLMIQSLTDETFKKVCIDSGAGESVCPVEAFPSYETKKTAKTGMSYTAAGGDSLVNVGEKRPEFTAGGVNAWMAFQATTKVQKPLAAATRITEKGNGIWLDEEGCESYILNKKTGTKIPLSIENGIYMMEMLVKTKAAAPFQGQVKR